MPQHYGQNQPPPQQQQPQMPGGVGAAALPPTGLQQQLAALQQRNMMASQMGVNPQMQQFGMGQAMQAQGMGGLPQPATGGTTSLQQMANNLAQQYGLPIGRGNLFNEQGIAMQTPEQLAMASGGTMTMGQAAAAMQQISNAIASQKQEQATEQGLATLSAGMGLVQQRGRGSLATLQSGMYQQMAQMYAGQEYEGADFSYYIQREQQLIERELQRKAEKRAKKGAIVGSIMGGIGLLAAPFTGGATLGLAAQGLSQTGNWI